MGSTERRIDSSWNDPVIIENYKEMVSQYYGCYGAILEVSVAPAEDGEDTAAVPLKDFPYFIDFDPKKREVYEIVSETGEMMSRSLDEVGVRKGTTTSDSHEQLDIFGGFSQEFTFAGTGGGHSIQGQWGSRDISQQQYEDVRSTDRVESYARPSLTRPSSPRCTTSSQATIWAPTALYSSCSRARTSLSRKRPS